MKALDFIRLKILRDYDQNREETMAKIQNQVRAVLQFFFPERQREILLFLLFLPLIGALSFCGRDQQEIGALARPGFQETEKNVILSYQYQGEKPFSGNLPIHLGIKDEEGAVIREKLTQAAAEFQATVLRRDTKDKIEKARYLPSQWRGIEVEYQYQPADLFLAEGEWNYFELFREERQRKIKIKAVLRYQTESAAAEITEDLRAEDFADEYVRELLAKRLKQTITGLEQEKTQELNLPAELEGGRLRWTALQSESSLGSMALGFVVAALFLSILSRAAAREKQREREKRYLRDFAQMMQHLVLLLKCGKSPFAAVSGICGSTAGFGPEFALALESCRQGLYHQKPFAAVIQVFYRICPLPDIQQFERLLLMAQERGDEQSIVYLEQLKDKLFADRLRQGHEYMQKTTSRLLFPMLLFLIIIIILTMFPAFEGV